MSIKQVMVYAYTKELPNDPYKTTQCSNQDLFSWVEGEGIMNLKKVQFRKVFCEEEGVR